MLPQTVNTITFSPSFSLLLSEEKEEKEVILVCFVSVYLFCFVFLGLFILLSWFSIFIFYFLTDRMVETGEEKNHDFPEEKNDNIICKLSNKTDNYVQVATTTK